MARQRCILSLFIVGSMLLFFTVVTAFRLRDLAPRSSTERLVSSRRNPLLEKCDGCDSESDHQNHLSVSALKVKEITSRRSYEDVKKAVKEKQLILNEKKLRKDNHRPQSIINSDSDDEDDDSDDDDSDAVMVTPVRLATKQSARNANKKMSSSSMLSPKIKTKPVSFSATLPESDDDDQDSDQDDDKINDSDGDTSDKDETGNSDDSDGSVNEDSEDNDSKSDYDDDDDDSEDKMDKNTDKVNIQTEKKIPITIHDQKESKSLLQNILDHKPDAKKVIIIKKPIHGNVYDSASDEDDGQSLHLTTLRKIKTENYNNSAERSNIDNSKQPKISHHSQKLPKHAVSQPIAIIKPTKNIKEISSIPKAIQDKTKDNIKEEHKPQQDKDKKPDPKTIREDNKKEHITQERKTLSQPPEPEKSKISNNTDNKNKIDKNSAATKTKSKPRESIKEEPAGKVHTETKLGQAKEKSVLKHASDALYRKNFLQSEFEDFYAFLPSFAPNFSRIHNPECRRHGQILLRQLRGSKLWALNMLDASGKIPSGVLQGNGNQLGDFDQCLSARARVRLESGHVVRVRGQYCLAQLDVSADHDELRLPVHLAQARNLMKSKLDDPGHFIPRFSSLNWGICLPASCGAEDAEFILRDTLRHYQLAGLRLRVNVDPLNCHTEDEDWWDAWLDPLTLITISLFSSILLLVLYATVKDLLSSKSSGKEDSETKEQPNDALSPAEDEADNETAEETTAQKQGAEATGVVGAFSLRRSWRRLMRGGDAEDVACIHGVRALCSLALLLAHRIIPVANTPYVNRVRLTEVSHTPLSYALRVGWVYTDAFLLLSGTLTAHRLSADLDTDAVPWLRRFIARYVRLTPALLGVVLFYAYVWDHLGSGPLWGTLVSQNAKLCQESWWWNLLYVQNFFAFDEMCAPQTYQLALDMQLTLVAAALVWLLRARPVPAVGVIFALQAAAAYARYSATVEHRLSLLIYHGVSVSQLYRTARLSYASTLHRSTPYLFGLALGVLLQRLPSRSISKLVLAPCWLAFLCCWAGSVYAVLDAADAGTRYSAAAAARYAALAPPAAAAALAWLIYAAHSGNAQWINNLLCARPLVLVSRLSYALYLVQFLVFFSNAATVRTATEFSILSILDFHEFATIFAAATALTLTLVIPMQSLSKYVMTFDVGDESKQEENEEEMGDDPQESELEVCLDDAVTEDRRQESKGVKGEVENIRGSRIMAHRELLEEILEAEVEYESQRDAREEGLEEILEEEEDDLLEEEEEELELVEGEEVEVLEVEGGEDDFWAERREEWTPRRASRYVDQDDEWEWTSNEPGAGSGPSSHRYSR